MWRLWCHSLISTCSSYQLRHFPPSATLLNKIRTDQPPLIYKAYASSQNFTHDLWKLHRLYSLFSRCGLFIPGCQGWYATAVSSENHEYRSSISRMTSIAIPAPANGFDWALKAFEQRLTPSESAQFGCTSLDDLKSTILSIQAEQRSRKKMMHMGRVQAFLEAMEQFGKVIEVFVNVNSILAFVWGPIKLLLLVRACSLPSLTVFPWP